MLNSWPWTLPKPCSPTPRPHSLEAALDQAFHLADRGDARAGRALAEQALVEARAQHDQPRTARALAIVANASRSLADYERAAAAALESVELLESAGLGVAAAKIDLALVFFDLGDYPRALSHLFEARKALCATRPTAASTRGARMQRAWCSRGSASSISRAHRSSARWRCAATPATSGGAATTLNSLGVVHLRIAQQPGTEPRTTRSELESRARRTSTRRASSRRNSVTTTWCCLPRSTSPARSADMGCYGEALDRFLAQLATARELGDRHNESLILANAGEAALRAGQLEQRAHARRGGAGRRAVDVLEGPRARGAPRSFRSPARRCDDFAAALAHYKAHHVLEREMQAAEARRSTQAQALRSAIERAQRETARLRRENRCSSGRRAQDALTGLANRRAFDDALAARLVDDARIGRAARRRRVRPRPLQVDQRSLYACGRRFGPARGRGVLRAVCRASDLAARIGGEEFVLLLPGADRNAACAIAERVRAELAFRPFAALAPGVRVTLSAGVAVDNGEGSAEDLLRAADAALYRAKGEGRDRVCA